MSLYIVYGIMTKKIYTQQTRLFKLFLICSWLNLRIENLWLRKAHCAVTPVTDLLDNPSPISPSFQTSVPGNAELTAPAGASNSSPSYSPLALSWHHSSDRFRGINPLFSQVLWIQFCFLN